MKNQFEDKTNGLKKFFSAATAILSIYVLLFSTVTIKAQNDSESANSLTAPGTVFSNPAAIAPADRASNNAGTNPGVPPSNYPSTITVAGLSGTVTKVTVTFAVTGTFPDDLDVLLVGPTGAMSLVMSDAGGSGDPVNVTYTFDQTAAGLMPDAPTTIVPAGTFQPSNYAGLATPEPGGQDNFPTAGGLMSYPTTFNIFNGTNPNGDWKLYVVDDQNLDTNSLPGGWSIDITTGSAQAGCPTAKAPLDYDGDGKTDATVVRNTGGGSSGQITWFSRNSSNGNLIATPFGMNGDRFVSGDFDGDNKADITVWRAGAQGVFYILQSQTSTFRSDAFGQTGDDPTVVGDYTGDGKTDPAIYRAGADTGLPSFWAYRASSGPNSGQIVIVQWGQNGDFPAPGDYDGDSKNDFVVQRNAGGGAANFFMNQTTGGLATIRFGTPTDVVVPGYYDSDCKTDIAVTRGIGGAYNWYIRKSTDGTLQSFIFGLSASDFQTPGDYDGDKITDISVWRPDATTPSNTAFYWRRSTDGALGVQQWGQQGDYPVARFNGH